MFKNLFNKKRTQDDIEMEIRAAINEIINEQPCGKRDFSKLLSMDEELLESEYFNPILTIAFETMVEQAENAFLCDVDIQVVLDFLKDISTFPNKAQSGYAELWLKHGELFEQKPQRYMSVLDPTRDIEEQFEELRSNVEVYQKDFMLIMNTVKDAIAKFQKRDSYDKSDLDGAYERFSILTGFMLVDFTEEQILSARKALLSYALNDDIEGARDCYNMCKKHFYGKYLSLIKTDKTVVPVVDELICNAILQSGSDGEVPHDELRRYTEELETFTDELSSVPEMAEDVKLFIDVSRYFGLYGG